MVALLLFFAALVSIGFFVLLLAAEFLPSMRIPARAYVQVGDGIVYRKQKVSTHPSPRANDIHPTAHGDTYTYFIDKFWTVEKVLRDGRILVTTRTRKQHFLQLSDPYLRKAGLITRLRYWNRFPHLGAGHLTAE